MSGRIHSVLLWPGGKRHCNVAVSPTSFITNSPDTSVQNKKKISKFKYWPFIPSASGISNNQVLIIAKYSFFSSMQ